MTYDRMSTYITWGGRIGVNAASPEIWQCGVHLTNDPSTDGPGLPTHAELQDLFEDTILPFHQTPELYLSPGAVLLWTRAASLDNQGHYTADPVIHELPGGQSGGAVSEGSASPQDSCCVTLWSGMTLGRANYGRFYLPWWAVQVPSEFGQAIVPAGAMTALTTWFNEFNAWAASTLSATAKIRIMSKIGSGTTKDVAQLRIGKTKDTQRRRRNRIPEDYSVVNV